MKYLKIHYLDSVNLKSEMLNFRNFSNNKSFQKMQKKNTKKLQEKFISSNQSLEHVSSKLLFM